MVPRHAGVLSALGMLFADVTKDFSASITPADAQYIRIKATNYGKLPSWHPGFAEGGDAYIFVDEVTVE